MLGPTDFYPVYSDYVSNIMTVFEGNEQDELEDKTQRVGVGNTHVDVQTAEDGASVYTVAGARRGQQALVRRRLASPMATASWVGMKTSRPPTGPRSRCA